MICPRCRQDAPTVVRGVRAYCMACGAPRPLATAASAFNVAGQPSRVGGSVAGVLGRVSLATGLLVALVLGGLAKILFAMTAALWVGGFVTVLTLLVALPLILGGRRLRMSGEERSRAAHLEAVFALATQRRGVLTPRDVARALSIQDEAADAMLTALAKDPDSGVSLEVDDNGGLTYRFVDIAAAASGGRVRVAEQPWTAPDTGYTHPPAARPVRVSPVAAQPRVIDAELIEEEDAASVPPAARRVVR